MKRRRIKLVWGAAKVIRGRWYFGLFGLYDRLEGEREGGLAISLRGVTLWALGLLAAAYVAGTAALFSFWQRNPYCLLTYGDAFFYPVRRGVVAEKKGRAFIAEGHELLKAQQWGDGARRLRQGLTLYPGDLSARQALAKFMVMANQRPQAVKLLTEGLPREFPGRTYLLGLFDLAEQGDDPDLVVATADRYLPLLRSEAAAVERRWLTGRKFNALLAATRPADALALAMAEEPGELAAEYRVLALLELGRAGEAAAFLDTWRSRPGADLNAVRRLQVRVGREAGRPEEMERALEEMRASAPTDPRQAVYGVVQRAMAGREASAQAALTDYLFRFGGTVANLQLVAEPLAEIGQRALFERGVAAARDQGFGLQALRVLQVQLHVQRGEWAEAAAGLAQMKPGAGRAVPAAEQFWREWMGRLVAAAGTTAADAAQGSLVEFLRGRPWPMKIFRTSIAALRRAGRVETARDVIALAEGGFPASRWVQTQKAEVAKALAAEQAGKAPGAAAAGGPDGRLKLERFFFERVDELVRERKWLEAESLIREARGMMPPLSWVEPRDGDLRLAEVRLNQGRGEVPMMLAAARVYLNGDVERSRRVGALAREAWAAGDKSGAIALAEAVLQRTPEDVPAKRLLAELKPKPTEAK